MTHFRQGTITGAVVSTILIVGTFLVLAGCSSPLRAIAGSHIGPLHSQIATQIHPPMPFSFTLDVAQDPWTSSVTYGPVTVSSEVGLSGKGDKLAGLLLALEPVPLEAAPL